MSGFALGNVRNEKILRQLTRGLGLATLCAALSGCYYYVPPTTQLACVPTGAPPAAQGQYYQAPQGYQAPPSQQAPAPQWQGQPQAAGGCPDGMAASYVQTPGYTAPYGYGYGYPDYGGYPSYGYGYPDYGYYGYPGYGYGYGYAPVTVGVGFGFGYRGHWGGRWR